MRPHLEYASPAVWDPWMDKHIKQTEAVQRQSAHFMKICWERTPGTVTNLLSDLDWPSYKIEGKLLISHFFIRLSMVNQRWNSQLSYIKRHNRRLRLSHNDRFIELTTKTDTYRNSFYCRTIKEWNSLPSNVLDIEKNPLFQKAFRLD